MRDRVFESFFEKQRNEAQALVAQSSLLSLEHEPGLYPRRYMARFYCKTLVIQEGEFSDHLGFAVGIDFPPDYLRVAPEPGRLLGLLWPKEIWHPNVRYPFVCIGKVRSGTPLVEILFRVFEVLTYQRYTPNEMDALNQEACAWARNQIARFPVDSRPLKLSAPNFEVSALEEGAVA